MSDEKEEKRDFTDLHLKAEISARIDYVRQIAYGLEDPELLTWVRNRLSEPYRIIQRKLKPDVPK